MMLESVGFREIVVQCGYGDSGRTDPHVDLVFTARGDTFPLTVT